MVLACRAFYMIL